ncbi:hypothetical protein [Paenibacillus sp. GYB004]|uniref:hypothetical protein n=1 Tax=Paenibacillus sp. GYB004 TaxID=2994393 RepID=UPI002F969281
MRPEQLDMFASTVEEVAAPAAPPQAPILRGFYYERATDKFVSFYLGERYYEEPAKGCKLPKEWQRRMKEERSI